MTNIDFIHQRIIDQSEITKSIHRWGLSSQQVVFTNGCFDILHRGHIEYLSQAADLGDKFVIGLNSDASIKRIKGDNRPVQDERSRSMILAALRFVDAVVLFDEDTPFDLINKIKPDVLVKGGDYDPEIHDPSHEKYIVGSDIVRENGGQVTAIAFVEGYSTSNIISKIEA